MSSYTTELRYICESLAGKTESDGYTKIDDILEASHDKIFDFDYPIYDENHKAELEKKILLHYYTREIGAETYGLWHLQLRSRMWDIMPYYYEMYRTAALEFNPIHDVDYVKTHHGTDATVGTSTTVQSTEGSSNRDITSEGEKHDTNTNNSTDTEWSLYSDTPQGSIQNVDVQNNAYLTNATKNTDTYTASGAADSTNENTTNDDLTYDETKNNSLNSREDGTNEWTETMAGKVGTYSYSKLIKEYREQVLNIDLMIINDLKDLFMMLW